MKFETLAVHVGQASDPAYGAVMQPIYQVSTFAYKSVNRWGFLMFANSPRARRWRTVLRCSKVVRTVLLSAQAWLWKRRPLPPSRNPGVLTDLQQALVHVWVR